MSGGMFWKIEMNFSWYSVDYPADDGGYCLRCFRVGIFHARVDCPKPSREATQNRSHRITNGMLVVEDTEDYGAHRDRGGNDGSTSSMSVERDGMTVVR